MIILTATARSSGVGFLHQGQLAATLTLASASCATAELGLLALQCSVYYPERTGFTSRRERKKKKVPLNLLCCETSVLSLMKIAVGAGVGGGGGGGGGKGWGRLEQ